MPAERDDMPPLTEDVLRRRLAELEARFQAEVGAHAHTRAERARAELRLEQLFAHTPVALIVLRGPELTVGEAYATYYGWRERGSAAPPQGLIVGRPLAEQMRSLPDEAKRVAEEVLRSGVPGCLKEVEIDLVGRKGPSWWDADLIPLRATTDAPSILLLASDVTRHVLARRRLRDLLAAQRRYRAIAETIPYGIWRTDAQGRIEYLSQSMLDLLAMSHKDALGYGWLERLSPHERELLLARWRRCSETGQGWEYEHHIVAQDGASRIVLSRGRPVCDESGAIKHWVGINLDITERVEMERQLRELNAELDRRVAEHTAMAEQRAVQLRRLAAELTRAEQRERRRLARLLHDHLQQLLVGAKLNINVLQKRVEAVYKAETPPPGAPCLEPTVVGAVAQVDDLLDEAIAASRSLTAQLSPSVLYDMGLPAALEWLGRSMGETHGLRVEVDAAPDADPPCEDMRVLLFSSARELLLNVVKHARVRDARLTLCNTADGRVQLAVADEGVGFRALSSRAPGAAVSGLGLFGIRERIELLGGEVWVRSEPGNGTTVTVTALLTSASPPDREHGLPQGGALPADGVTPRDLESPESRPLPSGAPAVADGVITVLLADDHAMVRRGLCSLFDDQPDIRVVGQAEDGQQALEMVRALQPDVVVMDVTMPRLNGVEATQAILAEAPQARVIGLSMHDDREIAAAMLAAGAAIYLTKSGPPDDLLAAVRACYCSALRR